MRGFSDSGGPTPPPTAFAMGQQARIGTKRSASLSDLHSLDSCLPMAESNNDSLLSRALAQQRLGTSPQVCALEQPDHLQALVWCGERGTIVMRCVANKA